MWDWREMFGNVRKFPEISRGARVFQKRRTGSIIALLRSEGSSDGSSYFPRSITARR